jgi:hypothetical protein
MAWRSRVPRKRPKESFVSAAPIWRTRTDRNDLTSGGAGNRCGTVCWRGERSALPDVGAGEAAFMKRHARHSDVRSVPLRELGGERFGDWAVKLLAEL